MLYARHLWLLTVVYLLTVAVLVGEGSTGNQDFSNPFKDPRSYIVERIEYADLMVKGTVIAINDSVVSQEGFDPETRSYGYLFTFVTLQVDTVLKGAHDAPTLTFWHWGGRRWNKRMRTTFSSEFVAGRKVILFLFSEELEFPLAEGLESPPYRLGNKNDHYVVQNDSVYWADALWRAKWREKRGRTDFRVEPLYSLESMFGVVGEHLRSTSIESLAVRADVVAVGEVIEKRAVLDERGRSWEIVLFGNGSIVKGEVAQMPLEIKSAGIVERWSGRVHNRAVFPENERILVFLREQPDGIYRPLRTYKAAQVLSGQNEESAVVQKISAVLGH